MVLGGRLRRLRESRGIMSAEAGEAIRASRSKISRLELGRIGFKRRDVVDLLALYGVHDDLERDGWLAQVEQANASGWVHDYSDVLPEGGETRLELEQAAGVIRSYEVQFVPGLLQNADYARAVIRSDHPDASRAEVERRVDLQIERRQLLYCPQPPALWVVVDEAVLHRQPDGAMTLRQQLEHLIEITQLPHVTLQVVPFRTGVAAGGAITLLRFSEPELADVVFLEQGTGALCLSKPADTDHYTQVMDRLSTFAETPEATIMILHRILKVT
jgi:transcriptional regulator with XRE-family HTH domain